MPNELCAAGGGGVEEALVSAMNSPTKSYARRVYGQVKWSCRERGQRGSSSNSKVKLTPTVIKATLASACFSLLCNPVLQIPWFCPKVQGSSFTVDRSRYIHYLMDATEGYTSIWVKRSTLELVINSQHRFWSNVFRTVEVFASIVFCVYSIHSTQMRESPVLVFLFPCLLLSAQLHMWCLTSLFSYRSWQMKYPSFFVRRI